MIRHRRAVLLELGINEIDSDYSPFGKDKRGEFGYFKISKMPKAFCLSRGCRLRYTSFQIASGNFGTPETVKQNARLWKYLKDEG
jgi:hypothetical protein